ncbi:MAG: recombination protein RecR [Candidatus Latescibacterota bacterium]|nr:MAG: recombination protein RecR [Candidatus Latescibacterota bacterium]
MEYGSETLASLVKQFARMPGVGLKTAQRLALYLLRSKPEDVERLGTLVLELKDKVGFCQVCGSITEDEKCAICKDTSRNTETICVVEQPQDVLVLEKTGEYRGLYHVLHGVLSPIDGVGPDNINLAALEERVRKDKVKEVIIATNPSVEGDTTALYIAKALESGGCTVTRLARGLPVGGSLEFADEVTLARAIERREKL